MPPLLKKKHSHKRIGGRRAHKAYRQQSLAKCPQCGSARLQHRACSQCGYYNGRAVLAVGDAE